MNGAMFVRGSFRGGFIGQIESVDRELGKTQLRLRVGASGGLSALAITAKGNQGNGA
jgi:hypothetical protein